MDGRTLGLTEIILSAAIMYVFIGWQLYATRKSQAKDRADRKSASKESSSAWHAEGEHPLADR